MAGDDGDRGYHGLPRTASPTGRPGQLGVVPAALDARLPALLIQPRSR